MCGTHDIPHILFRIADTSDVRNGPEMDHPNHEYETPGVDVEIVTL